MSTKKKQHFVPQLHLAHFTYDGERLHVYDKFKQKAFIKNKREVAEEHAFYNIPTELITSDVAKAGIYPQMIEDVLAGIEGRLDVIWFLRGPDNIAAGKGIPPAFSQKWAWLSGRYLLATSKAS